MTDPAGIPDDVSIDELREAVEHMRGVPALKRLGILVSCVLTVLACTGCGTDCKCGPGGGAPEYTPPPPPPDAGDAGDAMSD